MLALLVENMGTIIVSIILIFIVAAIIRTLRKKVLHAAADVQDVRRPECAIRRNK